VRVDGEFDTTSDVGRDGLRIQSNANQYVSDLLTLYSQSSHSNSGTRGLDLISEQTYVETALDRELVPAVFTGEFCLVIITGNAGDGKTAFLQKFEARAKDEGAELDHSLPNGCRFTLHGRKYVSNYDGSQDEGDRSSNEVLHKFFAPYGGDDSSTWPENEVRLIAINEGRLIDFLTSEESKFSLLNRIVRNGLVTSEPSYGVAIVNLNLRSVMAAMSETEESIFERFIKRLIKKELWEPCQTCDLNSRCYVIHNVRTFQDETAGPKVIERLNGNFDYSQKTLL
jgi:hypothetical protein